MNLKLLLAIALGLVLATPASAKTVVITADRMLDVIAGRMVEAPVIVVDGGRIVSVTARGEPAAAVPADAAHIDLPGKTLLPGLIDMHVHLTTLPEIRGYHRFEYSDSFWSAVSVANAGRTLRAGFTTVRDLGSYSFQDVGLRQAIDGGWVSGPRIVTAGYKLCALGGQCDENLLPPSLDAAQPSVVRSPEDGRAKVRWAHKYGAQVIKLSISDTASLSGAGSKQMLSDEEIRVMVAEAHRLGLRVAAHAYGDPSIRAAVEGGVDTIEHATPASDATLALAAKRRVWFDIDLYKTEYFALHRTDGTPEQRAAQLAEVRRVQHDAFRRVLRAGIPMLFGTDAGVYPHGENARQFALMVEAGMTPLQAIRAATSIAAQALDREAEVGAIAVGRWGDLIAVGGNPLTDVRTLEHVDAVIKGGELVR